MRTETNINDCGTSGGGGGGGAAVQAFTYVATGAEGDTFTVDLPTAQADTNFFAQVTGGGLAGFLLFDAPIAQNTVNSIQVKCSAAPSQGDVLCISIFERTA